MIKKIFSLIGLSILLINTTIVNAKENNNIFVKYISNDYIIDIYYGCIEGDMSCDKITYHGVNKKNKKEITLHGEVITKGPYLTFIGYKFKNGNYTYIINDNAIDSDSQNSMLKIFVKNKNKQNLIYQTKLTSFENPKFQFPKYEHYIK